MDSLFTKRLGENMIFSTVAAPSILRRSFSITCGLQEGYGPSGKLHTVEEGIQAAMAWMKSKAAASKSFLTGTFGTGEVVYAWSEGPGKAGGGHEPVLEFHGEVSPIYSADLTDEEAKNLLQELASELGSAMSQTRVYLSYREEAWIIQAEQTVTPTGETV